MNADEARARLPRIDAEEATALTNLQLLTALRSDYTRRLEALGRPHNRIEWQEHDALKEVLGQLERGVSSNEGFRFPELAPLLDTPGIGATEKLIATLRAERAELRACAERWPEAHTTRAFRYVGAPFKHTVDGRTLEPGDVAQLTQSQALAFADRFEAVVEQDGVRA